ncbi:MAG TPA: OsmC family protein [Chitinophagaceae bacterium]|nr:MAG: OsmC family protein [Bacteroidetes bacterium OLB11]HMN32670.1 OsmC family protein [Chitinophagaceae bacterium]
MTAEIIYLGDLRTEATHQFSNSTIQTDAPLDNHGKAQRFSPTDMVATALGSCMLTVMGISANTHHIQLESTKVTIEKIMTEDPLRRIGEVKVDFYFPKEISYNEKQKAILEKAALTCPVYMSLHEKVKKNVHFHWND